MWFTLFLYQLKSAPLTPFESLDKLRGEFTPLDRDSFIQVGQILSIDATKKLVYLANQDTVSYKFMIIVSSQHHRGELSTVLPTLKDALVFDALNVKGRIASDSSLSSWERTSHTRRFQQLKQLHERQLIEKVGPHLVIQDSFSMPLSSTPTRYCQVKI